MSKRPSSKDSGSAAAPRLSVVMPVYNALPYLDEAVESILNQTLSDFEFVILDDASTDGSRERLREWAKRDDRIRLLEVSKNLGPALSSDFVAREARAPIVARQDADDISCPTRLEEQWQVLDRYPDAGVVGGLLYTIDGEGRQTRNAEPWRLTRKSMFPPFGNGPMMYRREVFEAVGGFRKDCEFWEDFDLIIRMAAVTKVLVIPRVLYKVRHSTRSTRFTSSQERLERALDLLFRSTERIARRRPYDDLLRAERSPDSKSDPRVFVALGSIRLWAGERPRLFRRMLSHAKLSWNMKTATALIWTAWASASPSSLRAFLMLLLRGRNQLGSKIPIEAPLQWAPFEGARPLSSLKGKP